MNPNQSNRQPHLRSECSLSSPAKLILTRLLALCAILLLSLLVCIPTSSYSHQRMSSPPSPIAGATTTSINLLNELAAPLANWPAALSPMAIAGNGLFSSSQKGVKDEKPLSTWVETTSGTTNNLFSVHFVSANEGWAVGFSNTILHTTDGGANWAAQTNQGSVPVSSYLGVRFVDANIGWAGGGSAVMRTTNGGASWAEQGATQDGRFRNNLFTVSSTAAWIPTQNAVSSIRWFSRFTVGVGEENFNVIGSSALYYDMYFTDPDNGWAVGTGPIVRITNGSSVSPSFTFQTSSPFPRLNGIHMLDANTGWVVGDAGLIWKTTDGGSSWTTQTSGTPNNLKSVHFVDVNTGWAVGAVGVILATTDGGGTWNAETSGVSVELRRVFFVNANVGYAVGASGTILKREVVASPTLGNYPDTTVQAGANATVTPDAAPTSTASMNVSTTSAFKGTVAASPTTGVVMVTNAHPAGSYPVTVTAFSSAGATRTKTFTLTVANPLQCLNVAFSESSGSPFAAGSYPQAVAVGDFNGDGKLDLTTANESSWNVTVLLGNGSGGFSPASGSPFAVGTNPWSVAVGDFNGDGKQDLSASGHNNVAVLLGNGSGGFSPANGSPFAVFGLSPLSVAVGDFNGDGKQDLTTANQDSHNVTVLLGNGNSGFSPASGSPFALGSFYPRSVAVGDFNGDGKQDFTTANRVSNNVTALLGNGSGGFSPASGSPFAVGTGPYSVAVGDFNGDGKQDLTTANASSWNVTVLLGNGSGGLSPASGSPFAVGTDPWSVAVGDFNGDGKQDLSASGHNNVAVLLGNGSGGFSPASGSPFAVGSSPFSVAVGDFNGDGKLDLTTANAVSNNVTVLLNTCTSNTAPIISAVGVTRQQGSPSANATIANVNDLEDPETALTVTVNGGGSATVNGVMVSGISVDGSGVVTADVIADCTATTATFTLRVTDTGGLFNEATLTVTVDPNTAPALTYASPQSVAFGGALNVTSTSASDNGSITGYAVQAGHGLTTPPTVDASGVVSITNAQPSGAHTITIRATDNCGASTDAAFTLEVQPAPPTLGNYPDTTVQAGANTTVTPDAAPTGTTSMNVSSSTNFKGTFFADPATGVVRVTNAHPAGMYTVTVTAFNSVGATTTKTFTLTVTNPTQCDYLGFSGATGSPFGVGTSPVSVAVGDFNRDGQQDFAVANQSSNNVSILLGTGTGSFGAATNFGVGDYPYSVAVGDFNGDGKLDLTTANYWAGNVTVLLGDGSAGFSEAPGSPFGDSSGPTSVAVGDFNGDGKLDLATAEADGEVTVLLGDGSGGFSPVSGSPFPVGSTPLAVAVGDFNSDGKLDLATANAGSSTLTVLLGNGSGGFSPATGSPFAVGSTPLSVTVGDLNSDGKLDLTTANQGSWNVTVLLGDGLGGFSPASGSPFTVGSNPLSVAVGDFNGDGKLDLTTANHSISAVTVLLGNGSGGFAAASGSPFAVGARPYSVAVGDFNGDGKQDLTTANLSSDNVTVLLNTCTSNTAPTISALGVTRQQGSPSANATIANVNDLEDLETALTVTVNGGASATVNLVTVSGISVDGSGVATADVIADCTAATATFTLRVTDTSGLFNEATLTVTVNPNTAPTLTYASPQSVIFGGSLNVSPTSASDNGPVTYSVQAGHGLTTAPTVDSSGVVSIANAQPSGVHTITIRATDNCGAFTDAAFTLNVSDPPTLGNYPDTTVQAGANATVTPDAAPTGTTSINVSTASAFKGTLAASSATGVVQVTNAHPAGTYTVTLTAFDSGGVTTTKTFTLTVNNATQCDFISFSPASGSPFTVGLSPWSVAVGDFNGDVKQDLAIANRYSDKLTVLLGNGSGAFSPASGSPFAVGLSPWSVAVGDFNGDGKQDLTTANSGSNNVTVLLGNGSGGFSPASGSPFAVGSVAVSVAVGDFNGDGKQDLTTANYNSQNVTVLLGDGSGGFGPASGSPVAVGGSLPLSVAVGDFNGDGKQDLTTANYSPANVTVFLGNGIGGFTAASGSPFAVGAYPISVAVGDFNGDGMQDLTTANWDSNNVTVLLGNGSGGFSPASGSPFAVGLSPWSVAVGDFNGDGKQDLTTANRDSDNVTVLLGNGSGGFSPASGSPFAVGSAAISVAVGDFNGDGKQDLATANYSSINVTVLLNTCTSNTAPTINAVGVTRQQGSPSANATIANVNDLEDLETALTVTVNGGASATVNGVTVSGISISPAGVVTADVIADCSATTATFTLRVTDTLAFFNEATLTVTVDPNPAPTLTYASPQSVIFGGSLNLSPTATGDNGAVTYSVQAGHGLTTEPTVDASGAVSITNAQPPGAHTVTIRATDNCGAFTDATFTLNVGDMPTFAIDDVTHNEGNVGTTSYTFTVTKTGSTALNSSVNFTTVDGTATTANNDYQANSGTLTFLAADMTKTIAILANGDTTFEPDEAFTVHLSGASDATISDADGAGMITNDDVAPPATLGNYPDTTVQAGANTTVTPDAAPTNTTSINVSSSTNFKGTFSGDSATGVVRVTNAHPAGTHTVTVTAFNGPVVNTTKTFTLTVQAGTACTGASLFTNAPDSSVGTNPFLVAIGDFNNDGKQDFAAANVGSNNVSIRLGDGAGGFIGAPDVSVGSAPLSVAIGDFNNDGKQDIAVACYGPNTVSIRLGDGAGGFTGTANVSVGVAPFSVAIGDFNNDGKQDIAVANQNSHTVSIRLGDGLGGFSGTTNVSVGPEPESVAIGDFNNDGKQDIATANFTSNTVSIRSGDGAGGFTGTTEVSVGAGPYSVAIGDFNNDGKQDIAVANRSSDTVSICLGDGLGGFTGTTNVSVGAGPESVAIGDFNNDGKQDIAAANHSSTTISIRLGDGSGGFTGTTNVSVGSNPDSVAIGDFNGDGKQDFAAANEGSDTVSIRLGQCNPSPTIVAATGLSRQQGSPATNSQIATVTDDGGNGSVSVTVTSTNPSNGVSVSNIVNTGGNITADIVADCTASNATFTLQASDGSSTATDTLTVTVAANTAPTLVYSSPQSVVFGGTLNVSPTTASDNGAVTYSVQAGHGLTPPPTVDSSGVVSITNVEPAGSHTITVRATDNCGAFTDAAFTLNVGEMPTFTIDDVAHNEGDAGTTSYTFTVTKTGSTALSSSVNFTSVDGTATTANNDYQAQSGTLNFPATDTTKQITVLVNGDTTVEPDEAFTVHLSGASNATISDADGTGAITNDDVAPTLGPPWPMQGHDAQRTGRAAVPGPVTANVKWTYRFTSGPFFGLLQDQASPVVGPDGTIYQPTEDTFYAINPDGTLKWSLDFSGFGMRNAPALSPDGNTVYIIDGYDTGIAALDTQNGSVRWRYPFGAGEDVSYSSLAVDGNGTIYIGTRLPAALYAVNPNGTLKWRYAEPGGENLGIEAAPAIDVNGNVYVEINATGLVALDANGNYRWTSAPGGDYGWFTPTVGPDGTIYVAGDIDGQAPNQSAYALNPDGSVKWQRSADEIGAPGFFAGMVISADGSTVYTGRGNGNVYALNAATGATQWVSQVSTWDSLSGSPALGDNGILYLTSSGGELYAVWTGDGSLIWQYELETVSRYWGAQSPALGPDGTLYAVSSGLPPASGGIRGRLYAFKDSGCWFMLGSFNQSFLAAGGTGSVNVTAGEASCEWTAVSNDTFITITAGSSGSGNGTVDYLVEANPSASSRTGTMTIAGRTFRVNQAGIPPSLGNYPDTTVQLGANTTVTPDAAPFSAASMSVSTASAFRGTLAANPTTGVVTVTNAQPAGTYLVTVTAFNSAGTRTFTLTVNNPTSCDSTSFSASSGSPFTVGSLPAFAAVGDFNTDGNQDFAIANWGANNLTVLLGNGSGGFTAAGPAIAVGSNPVSVAVGDFNVDGRQDLAIAISSLFDNVTVLLGNGGGGFSPASGSPFDAGFTPKSVAVGDFNGDGKPDLATANWGSNNATVLLGNGGGGFSPASGSPFAAGTNPASVAVGDFNGDGKTDLATANYWGDNVTVLLGNGAGAFSPAIGSPFALAAGSHPASVAAGDFNGDGKQDLATANYLSNNLAVLLGDGSGGFSPAPGSPFTVVANPYSVVVADYNGDGKLDLATANVGSNNATVLLGNGLGGFSISTGSPFAVGSGPICVAAGDFNGDGKLDLATANQDTSNVTVLLNACTSNTAPTINTVGVTRQQGSPSANATIANVNDLEDPETALTVTVNGGASAMVNGVTVSGISVSPAGVVTADVVASCTATTATFTLRVTDTSELFNEATLTVTVNPNTAPALTYSSPQSVAFGGASNVTPTAASDNGAVTYSVQAGHGLTPPPTVDSTGAVSITTAQPSGAHTITIRATDNCGLFTDAVFTLNVGGMPTFAIDDVTHNEGDSGTTSYTFTVTKTGSTALNSSVNFTTVDGSATTANNDYQLNTGAVNFLATDTTKQITVLVNGDTTFEPDEAFTVHLSGVSGATISDADGTGTITNDETIPTALIVTKTADTNDGFCTLDDCSLREAMTNANANPDANTVHFNIPTSDPGFSGGVFTIQPASPLPTVTSPVTIDGKTQPAFAGTPIIELNGTNAGAGANGLRIPAGNSTVSGLAINRFNGHGILLETNGGNTINGNYIGTDVTGSVALGNTGSGVRLIGASDNTIGGTEAGAGNLIAFNGAGGAIAEVGTGNVISRNSIFSNTGMGIDLGADGVTANDAADVDTGANNMQNFPVITSATTNGTQVNIQGTLNTTASSAFTLEFFVNSSCGSSGNGEGQTYIGSANVNTNGSGDAAFNVIFTVSVSTSQRITATTTDAVGNTSEFSTCSSPTLIDLASFTATAYDDGVFLEWQTGMEVNNLGFRIYRDSAGNRALLNSQIIAGSALTAGSGTVLTAGQAYAWWVDANDAGKDAAFWLEDLDLNGASTWHGPYFAKQVGGKPPAQSRAALLSGVGHANSQGETRIVEPVAPLLSSNQSTPSKEIDLAASAAIKIGVQRAGWHRITQAELVSAGFDAKVDPRTLRLFVDGRELPIFVAGEDDGRFDSADALEFYGLGLDTPSTDTRVYWLVSGTQAGLRIVKAAPSKGVLLRDSFSYTVERRDKTVYFSALRNGDAENFFGAVVTTNAVSQGLTLKSLAPNAHTSAVLEISLQGVTTLAHRVAVSLNDSFAGYINFSGQARGVENFSVPQALLKAGANTVTLQSVNGPSDVSLVDAIRLSYQHSFAADDDLLAFAAQSGETVTISGFSSNDVRVFDVTGEGDVQELTVSIGEAKDGVSATITVSGAGDRRLLALTSSKALRGSSIKANLASRLTDAGNAADFVIIAPASFTGVIKPLADLRAKQDLITTVVDIEDIYDEFSFGNKSPQAIKDFLSFTATSWKLRPRFVLFVGDASYDSRNYLDLGAGDLVPTKLIDTTFMETASDDWFADFNGDGVADFSVGRLPVRSAQEASVVINKLLAYESAAPSAEIALVADRNDGFDFERASANLRGLIPSGIRVNEILRSRTDDASARNQLLDAINRGQKIVNYTGHGSGNVWRGNLLTAADGQRLTNKDHLSFLVVMTCLNGYFQDAVTDSLAEALIKSEGGAVAAWASSGLTLPADQAEMNRELYRLIFLQGEKGIPLGDAARLAKSAIKDKDVRLTWILLGDPTTRLR